MPVGGRIRSEYQNRGLFKFLMSEMTRKLVDTHPALVCRRMCIDKSNPRANRVLKSHRVLFERNYCVCSADNEMVDSLIFRLPRDVDGGAVELTAKDLSRMAVSSRGYWEHLFPTDYFLHDWRVYRFSADDVLSVFAEHSNFHCLAFYETTAHRSGEKNVSSLAMISTLKVGRDGNKLAIDFYGDVVDESEFARKLGLVMELVRKRGISFYRLLVVVPDGQGHVFATSLGEAVNMSGGKSVGLEIALRK